MQTALWWRGILLPLAASVAVAQTPPSRLVVGNNDLNQLRWIAGRWEGTRDNAPPEFVELAFDDDSTLTVTHFADRKFATPRTGMSVMLRGHKITAAAGATHWNLNGLDSTSASFQPQVATGYSFIWRRESGGRWIEVRSWPPGVDKPGHSETWIMHRVK